MKPFALVLAPALALGAFVLLRRRSRRDLDAGQLRDDSWGEAGSDVGGERDDVAEAAPVDFAYEPGPVPDPDARERESEQTEETRYERLAELEQEERRDVAERLRDDPLTERPDERAT